MDYATIIFMAAKKIGVSSSLLLAICSHESNLRNVMVEDDGGSPTYGICQVKLPTAEMLGYKGDADGLMNPKINATYAAQYLKYQKERYDMDLCKAVAAYNAGSYAESKIVPGKPRNLKYVRKVQERLDEDLQYKLDCES